MTVNCIADGMAVAVVVVGKYIRIHYVHHRDADFLLVLCCFFNGLKIALKMCWEEETFASNKIAVEICVCLCQRSHSVSVEKGTAVAFTNNKKRQSN